MNRSFKSIWSEAQGAWVAVSEVAAGRGKKSRGGAQVLSALAVGAALVTAPLLASAQTTIGLPSGAPDPSALLDLRSSAAPGARGLLNARVALTGATDQASFNGGVVASGRTVYNTATVGTMTPGLYTWNGSRWESNSVRYSSVNSTSKVAGSNYNNDGATGTNAMAVGVQASASNTNATALGFSSNAAGSNSIAIGNSDASGTASIAMGQGASATNFHSIALGFGSESTDNGSVAVGNNSSALGNGALAVGNGAYASSINSVVLGANAGVGSLTSNTLIAIGANAGQNVNGVNNLAIGLEAGQNIGSYGVSSTAGNNNTAIGTRSGQGIQGSRNVVNGWESGSTVTGNNNIALGPQAGNSVSGNFNSASGYYSGTGTTGTYNVASGHTSGANVTGSGNLAMGNRAGTLTQVLESPINAQPIIISSTALDVDNTVALGTQAVSTADDGVAIGNTARVNGVAGVSIGAGARALGDQSIAMGNGANASGVSSISIGTGNVVSGARSGAIGDPSFINADDSYAIGNNNSIAAGSNKNFILGNNVAIGAGLNGAVVLGDSSTVAASTVASYNPGSGTIIGTAIGSNVVSVGAVGAERRITNLAAGGADTDAVNVSQLKSVNAAVSAIDFPIRSGNAGPYTTAATGKDSLAVGATAAATSGNSTAVGEASRASSFSTALGYNANASGGNSMALGAGSGAIGVRQTVVGSSALADILSTESVVVGTGASATNSAFSTVVGTGASAVGNTNSVFGYQASALNVSNATAIGEGASVTGSAGIAVGSGAAATGNLTTAVGVGATSNGITGIAMGTNASNTVDNSVALGANAFDSAALSATTAGTTTYNSSVIAGKTFNYAGGAPIGVVSVGGPGVERRIQNVAAGLVSSTSTDAINGSQLNAVASQAAAIDFPIRSGNAQPYVTSAVGTNSLAVGATAKAGAIGATAVGEGANASYLDSIAIGRNAQVKTIVRPQTVAGDIAIGADSAAANYGFSSSGNVFVAAVALGAKANAAGSGAVAVGGNTFATNGSVAVGAGAIAGATPFGTAFATNLSQIAIGSGARAGANTTDFAGTNSIAIGNQAVASVADEHDTIAIGNVARAAAADTIALGTFSNANAGGALAFGRFAAAQAVGAIAIGYGATAKTSEGDVALGYGSVTAAPNPTNSATVNGHTYGPFAGNAPTSVVSVGTGVAGGERQITNVGAGRITALSTDAINGSQLYAMADALTSTVAAGTTHYYSVNSADQTAGSNYANDGATGANALAAGVGALASGGQTTAIGNGANAAVAGGVALGSASVSDRALVPSTGILAAGNFAVPYNTTDRTLLGAVSVGNATSYRQITNVADGTQSQDAVTVRQLTGALQSFAVTPTKYFHANSAAADSLAVGSESVAVGPQTVVNGNNAIGIGNGATVQISAPGSIAIGQGANTQLADSIAMGTSASAAAVQGVALGAGSIVNMAGGVALGAGSVANTAAGAKGYVPTGASAAQTAAVNATTSTLAGVSVGDAATGQLRQINGVAAGSVDSDAVNVSQLKAVQTAVVNIDNNAVKYDTTAAGTTNYNSVNLGNSNSTGPVTLGNVANGVAPNDAVNVQQLNAGVAGANAYTDARVNGLQGNIDGVARKAYAGVASAMALESAPYIAGKTTYAAGMGYYQSQGAVGIALRRTADNGRWSVTGGVSASAGGVAVRAGVSGIWD